ncbi:hypothetical protein [Rhizobium jaguaris]|nr:hypothetical protein [Rhizobium jaguaris]
MLALIGKAGLVEKFSLFQIAKDPDLVKNTVKAHLQHVTYHDVEKVEKLYGAAFKSGLYDEDTRAYFLEKAEIRHHFVHRNGRDKEGNFVPISITEVIAFGQMVVQLIEVCEEKYRKYREDRYPSGLMPVE